MGIDWTALGEEAVDLLRRYLMIDTTNPPGNEIEGAKFLAAVLGRDGIASETVESAPGRANLVARLAGDGSLPGIVLHHHIDVVYADRRYWTVDPFGGAIRDGYLYGRGALDMKSTGIMHLAAVLALKRAGLPLKRDLVFLATADEEAGSLYGARFVADARRDWLAGGEPTGWGGLRGESAATASADGATSRRSSAARVARPSAWHSTPSRTPRSSAGRRSTSRTFSSCPRSAATAPAGRSSGRSRRSPCGAAAAGWSGQCSTGTRPRSASTRSSARRSGASGSSPVSPARRSAASRAAASDDVSRRHVGRGETLETLRLPSTERARRSGGCDLLRVVVLFDHQGALAGHGSGPGVRRRIRV